MPRSGPRLDPAVTQQLSGQRAETTRSPGGSVSTNCYVFPARSWPIERT